MAVPSQVPLPSLNNEILIALFRAELYAYTSFPITFRRGIALVKKGSPKKHPPRAPAGASGTSESAALAPLNFKVPHEFHREFKTFAAQHGKKMVEVLQEAFASLKDKYGS